MHRDRPTDSCRHPFSPCTTDILSVDRPVVRSVVLPETAIRAAGEHGFDMLATDKMSVVQEEVHRDRSPLGNACTRLPRLPPSRRRWPGLQTELATRCRFPLPAATDTMSVVHRGTPRPTNRLMPTSVLPLYDGHLVRREPVECEHVCEFIKAADSRRRERSVRRPVARSVPGAIDRAVRGLAKRQRAPRARRPDRS